MYKLIKDRLAIPVSCVYPAHTSVHRKMLHDACCPPQISLRVCAEAHQVLHDLEGGLYETKRQLGIKPMLR